MTCCCSCKRTAHGVTLLLLFLFLHTTEEQQRTIFGSHAARYRVKANHSLSDLTFIVQKSLDALSLHDTNAIIPVTTRKERKEAHHTHQPHHTKKKVKKIERYQLE